MDKETAKRYLISLLALYFIGALLLFAFLAALFHQGIFNLLSDLGQIAALCFLLALLPAASYAGTCTAGLKLKEVTKGVIIAVCIFFPVTLAAVTVYGAVMLVPSIIQSIRVLKG